MQAVAGNWAQVDSAGAAVWLQNLAPGRSRDSAIAGYVGTVADSDPQKATQWVAAIVDEKTRLSVMEWIARPWLRMDEAAARAWIEQSELSQETKQELLHREK